MNYIDSITEKNVSSFTSKENKRKILDLQIAIILTNTFWAQKLEIDCSEIYEILIDMFPEAVGTIEKIVEKKDK